MNLQRVSIICPVYNEEKYIESCLLSILGQDYPTDSLEVLMVDGMSTDNTRDIITRYSQKHKHIRLLDNPLQVVPYALNKGIEQSTGDIIIRLDAHSSYPSHYVSRLVHHLCELKAENVGGVWQTLPANDSAVCQAIAIGSSHLFGVGGSMHKIGTKKIIETDTVPFGCYRREVFNKIGMFDTDLIRNQDDEFNARLIKNGGKIFLIPDIVIQYTARDSLTKMRKMYFQYGLYKPLVNKKLGSAATIRQFFPMLFLTGLVLGAVLSFLCPWIFYIYAAVLAIYLIIGFSVGLSHAFKTKEPLLILLMPWVFLNIHLSYGWGYLTGLYKLFTGKPFHVQSNR